MYLIYKLISHNDLRYLTSFQDFKLSIKAKSLIKTLQNHLALKSRQG